MLVAGVLFSTLRLLSFFGNATARIKRIATTLYGLIVSILELKNPFTVSFHTSFSSPRTRHVSAFEVTLKLIVLVPCPDELAQPHDVLPPLAPGVRRVLALQLARYGFVPSGFGLPR